MERRSFVELTPPPTPDGTKMGNGGLGARLPMELVCHVLDFVDPEDQEMFASVCKVCRQWYFAGVEYLYRHPKITSKNYQKFVKTICPSSTNIKPSPLACFVRRLDLSRIVHDGRPSFTARLLRRTQSSLQEFIAPQASFGHICLVALGHCRNLRILDLSLVSQSVSLEHLFIHIQDLSNLITLNFPRSSVFDPGKVEFRWPARIERFSLAGGISNSFLINTTVPETLQELRISHCPFAKHASIRHLLNRLSHQLTSLSVDHHIPCLPFNALDSILVMCPKLTHLLVAVDYITSHMFDEENTPPTHPLRRLDLESSGSPGVECKINPDDLYIAIGEERLNELRIVRVNRRLKWVERAKRDVEDLVDLLEEKEGERGTKEKVGVWEFGGDDREGFGGYFGYTGPPVYGIGYTTRVGSRHSS